MWFVPLGRADALAHWPMGVLLPSYIYQLGIMLLARFRPPLIVFSLPRPSVQSGCHLRTAELEPESLPGPRARLTASTASLGCPSDGKLPKQLTVRPIAPVT